MGLRHFGLHFYTFIDDMNTASDKNKWICFHYNIMNLAIYLKKSNWFKTFNSNKSVSRIMIISSVEVLLTQLIQLVSCLFSLQDVVAKFVWAYKTMKRKSNARFTCAKDCFAYLQNLCK